MARVLVLNAGSSSLKVAVFGADLSPLFSATVSEIGAHASLSAGGVAVAVDAPDHLASLARILERMEAAGIALTSLTAAGHRVVHGGATLTGPERVTPATLAEVEAAVPLAPLHNPHNLGAIRAVAALQPALPQVACFDTGFHATNPEVAVRYAIPAAEAAHGLRRFGFHGISYESLVRRLPGIAGGALPERLLGLHLGNGASLCAIQGGRSVATTMGYSPLDGLTMGTRSGAIDGNAVLRLAELHGIEGAARILNRESGLLGLGGASDMRTLVTLATEGSEEARFAIEHFRYWIVRHAGSMIAAMGGLDAIAFTGGIGENDRAMRAAVLSGLGWAGASCDPEANAANLPRLDAASGPVSAWIVPADEERHIAEATLALIG